MSWQNKLIRKNILNSPVVEQTPIVWKNSLFIVESWHERWVDNPASKECYIRVRNEENNSILSRTMNGFEYGSAFVWGDTVYVFGAGSTNEEDSQAIYMSSSDNMIDWTEPQLAILPENDEMLFNQSVCYNGKDFIMAYETDAYVKFSIKFAKANDLHNWQKIDRVVYGADRYAACPAIRYLDGYYYMVYLEYLIPEWKFSTYITRSKDLINWENAKHNPVLEPDPQISVHNDCPVHGCLDRNHPHHFTQEDLDLSAEEQQNCCPANSKECNASDMDFVEWKGKTKVYFTGGCQHWGGNLQMAEFNGTLKEFFESFF